MHWYEAADGTPKSHRRPRTCEDCRNHPKGGCLLPFRRSRKVRLFAAIERKPQFFTSLWFRNFLRDNRQEGK